MIMPDPAKIPQKIGKYDILDVLGSGGMGIVYRARDPRLGRNVAIKMLTEGFSGNPEMLKRFYQEASQTSALNHPNIVIVFEAGDEDGKPYIVMQYIEGDPLDKILKSKKRTPIELRLCIVEQICLALAYAHSNGVIHRDVKPGNVIVQRDGTAKLLDFGIARGDQTPIDRNLTDTGALIGTPAYMAPERLTGAPIDGRADIFSAGVLLYQLVTNKLPFEAEFPSIIQQILNDEPPPLSQFVADCPSGLDSIVTRAMAKNPGARYAFADEMASDLREIVETVKHAHIAELMAQAEKLFSEHSYLAAQDALRQLANLDNKHPEGRRLLSLVEKQLTQQEKERKALDLVRLAKQAASEREWDRAVELCGHAAELAPANAIVLEARGSALENRKIQQEVAQLLIETDTARKAGDLAGAKSHADSAYRLDPHNSQILALCSILEQEFEEERRKQELRAVLISATELLENRRLNEAAILVEKAESISPGDAEAIRLRDRLAIAQAHEKRISLIRKLEEKAAIANTVERLGAVSTELESALKDFPTDPSLLRIRIQLEPRIQQVENEAFVREVLRCARELPLEEALARVRKGLIRLPGNEQMVSLESALSERLAQQSKDRLLAQHLWQARQAIDDRLYLEAVKILERCQAEGLSSPEIQGLLELAKSAASQRISQELIERAYSQAKQLIEQENYDEACQLLRRSLVQVDEPVLRRQLEDTAKKQSMTQLQAKQVLVRVSGLVQAGLAGEALRLLEEQPAGVRRLPDVLEATEQVSKLAAGEVKFWSQIGRAYAGLGTISGLPDLKAAMQVEQDSQDSTPHEEARKRLRSRCEEIAKQQIKLLLASARESLGADETAQAESIVREALPWSEFASPEHQEELRAVQGEIASAQKVLRFRRVLRR